MSEEVWKPIPSLEGHLASSWGRILRVADQKILKVHMNDGYLYVAVAGKHYRAHRLVAEAFLGPCPEGMQVCHINCIRHDNRIENLKYGTPSENALDSVLDRLRRKKMPPPEPLSGIKTVTIFERAPNVWRIRREFHGPTRSFATETVRGSKADAERRMVEILGNG
jgi:hypothetical protein